MDFLDAGISAEYVQNVVWIPGEYDGEFMIAERAVLHNLSFVQKEYGAVVEEYANHENVGEPFKKFIINPRESGAHREFLSAHEERELMTIFCSLGKSDEYTETKIVESQKLLVKARLDESKKRAEKYSSLSIKLSFFVGVLLVLLLL